MSKSVVSKGSVPYVLTRYDLMGSIPEQCPKAADLLSEYGLHCIGCFANQEDTVETGTRVHGMTEEEMLEMIDEINTELESLWKKGKL